MADRFSVDLDGLDQLWRDLVLVSNTFTFTEDRAQSIADAVGHPLLASKVSEFASGWDDRRGKIIDSLDAMWRSTRTVHTTFTDLDDGLANVLTVDGA